MPDKKPCLICGDAKMYHTSKKRYGHTHTITPIKCFYCGKEGGHKGDCPAQLQDEIDALQETLNKLKENEK